MKSSDVSFNFDNSYARELEGFYVPWEGDVAPDPKIIKLNTELAHDLKFDATALDSREGASIFAGGVVPVGATTLAQAYAGHQFGGFSPQLGDGRAILLGEVIDHNGNRQDIHLKGSGRTPFSRGGDGKAVLGPVLREYLIAEAMFALGVPTTRALAAVTTGEDVMREGLKPGAVIARVASSHIRIGTFQFFAARKETDKLRTLADYTIQRHFPHLTDSDERYIGLLREVRDLQLSLVAKWVAAGFIHGVMNTDNVTISGETIDYGPCAFMDEYDPNTVFSSIDKQGRYAYANQPVIMQWNLSRFAETLLVLINPEDTDDAIRQATNEINVAPHVYEKYFGREMRLKLGLETEQQNDAELFSELFVSMEGQNVDFTNVFRRLADYENDQQDGIEGMFDDATKFNSWRTKWEARKMHERRTGPERALAMNAVNPIYIPRNHLVDAALKAAEDENDFSLFEKLHDVLSNPYEERPGLDAYTHPAPAEFGSFKTFCGT